jgi:glycosyltransferase involved in cell wall biosynthesis
MPVKAEHTSFLSDAIERWKQQTYGQRELIVVSTTLQVAEGAARFINVPPGLALGELRNIAIRESRGSIIAHWDVDDWYPDWRLSRQMHKVAYGYLSGSSRFFFHRPETHEAWEYCSPQDGEPWLAGSTFMYPRRMWEQDNFDPSSHVGEDTLWQRGKKKFNLEDRRLCVATIHKDNTSPKIPDRWWIPVEERLVLETMGRIS